MYDDLSGATAGRQALLQVVGATRTIGARKGKSRVALGAEPVPTHERERAIGLAISTRLQETRLRRVKRHSLIRHSLRLLPAQKVFHVGWWVRRCFSLQALSVFGLRSGIHSLRRTRHLEPLPALIATDLLLGGEIAVMVNVSD